MSDPVEMRTNFCSQNLLCPILFDHVLVEVLLKFLGFISKLISRSPELSFFFSRTSVWKTDLSGNRNGTDNRILSPYFLDRYSLSSFSSSRGPGTLFLLITRSMLSNACYSLPTQHYRDFYCLLTLKSKHCDHIVNFFIKNVFTHPS